VTNPVPYESPPLPQKSSYLTQLTVVAIILLVTAALAWCWSALDAVGRAFMIMGMVRPPAAFGNVPESANVAFLVVDVIVVLLAPVILFGGAQMLRHKMYHFVRVAAVLAMLPLATHCCFVVGLPMGIWALVLLANPEVKAVFGVPAGPP
jgi:hypothetical protein